MTDNSNDNTTASFPWFEEENFTGWFIQFKAHLRRTDSLVAIMGPRPEAPLGADGQPQVLNQAQTRDLTTRQEEYDAADNIAFSDLMKACRKNPRTKNLTESNDFASAWPLMERLRSRFHNIDEIKKAAHLLKYHTLTMAAGESGRDFVDREQREFNALSAMGVAVDNSMRLTKFIQEKTTNSQHHGLAKTIYSTPGMTLTRATGLFEGYEPAESPHVVANISDRCAYCKNKGHTIDQCRKKLKKNERGGDKKAHSQQNKLQKHPCAICDSHKHLTYKCPLKEDVKKCVKDLKKKKESNWGKDEGNSESD